MKKRKLIFKVLLFVLIVLCANIKVLANELPFDSSKLTYDLIYGEDVGKEIEKAHEELYEILSIKAIFAEIVQSIKNVFIPSFSAYTGLFALVAVCALSSLLKESFTRSFAQYVGIFCLAGYSFSLVSSLCSVLSEYISSLCSLVLSFLPSLCALTSVGTGAASAATEYTFLSLFVTFISSLCTYVILPLARACFVLCLICALSKNIDLSGVCSFLRNSTTFILGLLMTLLVGVLFFQKVLSSNADSVTFRTARYAAASFVPLVGNLLGESLKTVLSSVKVIGNITGIYGICAIIYLLIPPLAAILINKFFVLICASFAKILGSKSESDFLYEVNGVINLLNAAILIFSSVFIIAISLFLSFSKAVAV